MSIESELNYETFKKRNQELEKTNRQLLRLIIKSSTREIVIDELKKLKILKTDLNLKTDKLELIEIQKPKCKLSIKGKCTGNFSPLKCDGLDVPEECKGMLNIEKRMK